MTNKYMIVFAVITSILLIPGVRAEDSWHETVEKVKGSIGLIEYYEQIGSSEAIEEKSRVKRQLTGILVNESGLLLTSSSLFKAQLEFTSSSMFNKARLPEDIQVRFPGAESIPADFVGKDDDKGLAFIRLRSIPDNTPVQFLSRPDLKLGNRILILQHLGRQYNYELVVNERTVNAIIKIPQLKYLCENQLNTLSGFGLVVNPNGQGVGVLMTSDEISLSEPRGFHNTGESALAEVLSYESFSDLIKEPPVFREKETSRKKWLGINMQPFTRAMAEYYGIPGLKGILVNTILQDSPASKAGLQIGDVITSISDIAVEAEEDNDLQVFRQLIREQTEDAVTVTIFRNGTQSELPIALSDIPISQFLAEEVSNASLGISVKELTKDIILAKQIDFDTEGVWVSRVERAGWADIAGLGIGDLILRIDNHPVTGLEDIRTYFRELDESKPEYVSLFIRGGAETRFLFIKTNYE